MEHKNILLTGGHSGIGLELTKKLCHDGHKIGLIVRNESRKNDAINQLNSAKDIDFFIADLSKRDQIQNVCEAIMGKWNRLDVMFNNAGVLLDQLYMSDYGNELHLEINAISPYLLTKTLLPLLDKSVNPLVINTATARLHKKKVINIQDVKRPKRFVKLTGSYLDAKLVMVVLMNYLDSQSDGIKVISVDPGAIKTKMTAGDGMPFWLKPIRNLFFKTPEEGAEVLYDAAFNTKIKGSGIYITNGKLETIQPWFNDDHIKELLAINE